METCKSTLFCWRTTFWMSLAWWLGEAGEKGSVGVWQSEGLSQQSQFSLRWFSLLFFSMLCQLESPQIVLLRAGAFPQGDVVHSHLAAPASPTLPLQDHLENSSNVRHLHKGITTLCYIIIIVIISSSISFKRICRQDDFQSVVILTLSRPVPHNVIWVCLQPFPPVRPHTAGLYCFPFFTNTCSIPTWWPASLCLNDRHRLPSFHGGVSGRTSRAPRPVLLLPTSGMVR